MFHKIRRRIVIMTLLSVFIVLVGVIGVLNYTNYQTIAKETTKILEVLISNNGEFPQDTQMPPMNFESKEIPYETRYFYIQFNTRGVMTSINLDHIASIDQREAINYAYKILNQNQHSGFYENYGFLRSSDTESISIAFLDCTRNLAVFHKTLKTSILYSALGYLLVIVLSWFLSSETLKVYEIGDKKQKQFITDAGHEIKTPIAIIKADAQALEIDYGANEWCDDIQIQTDRLTKLTTNLITLAKMEERISYRAYELVDISDVVLRSVKSFKSIAKNQNKNYVYDIKENIMTKCDPKEIQELMDILLDNAVKYSADNGNIDIALKNDRNIILTVSNDVDEDFNPEIATHMFDRFYRGDTSHNSEKEGYGIGLSVARAICEKYSGSIHSAVKENKMIITVTLRSIK